MAQFSAKAVNEAGPSFVFRLANPNWVGIAERAQATLEAILEGNSEYRLNAPWSIEAIDVIR